MFLISPFRKYQKKLAELYRMKRSLDSDGSDPIIPGSELDNLVNEINEFIENGYAQAVFSYYAKKQPELIRIRTGEIESWEKAFGLDFDNVSKSLRHSLVGLVEGGGRYKIR